MPRGGYRKPNNPAPVSGPGALSRRTDGSPTQGSMEIPAGQYGERKQLQELQTSAKMAGSSTPQRKVMGLFDPDTRPDLPVTDGAPVGPGANYVQQPISQMINSDDPNIVIRAAYMAFPSESLRRIVEMLDSDGL